MSISKEYRKYLKSPEWTAKREMLIEDRGGKCQKCGEKGNHIHHVTYKNLFNEPLEDLLLFCEDCHEKTHREINESFKNKYRRTKKQKRRKSKKKSRQINSTTSPFKVIAACRIYEKGYDELSGKEKDHLKAEARRWLKAWAGVLNAQ